MKTIANRKKTIGKFSDGEKTEIRMTIFNACIHQGHKPIGRRIRVDSDGNKWASGNGCGLYYLLGLENGHCVHTGKTADAIDWNAMTGERNGNGNPRLQIRNAPTSI